MISPKIHAIRLLPSGRAISRCHWKPNDWILASDELQVTCQRCLAGLAFDRKKEALILKSDQDHQARAERKAFQEFLQREKYVQPKGANNK